MPTKVFTLTGGGCPFGKGCEIDSPACRQCQWFFRRGTYTFIWCLHPKQERADEKAKSKLPENKKTATRKPVSPKQRANKRANEKDKQIKIGATPKKRGRPKKAK